MALLLFSFAVAGVLSVAVTMANGFREQRQALAVETAVRGPMDYLADALRLASPSVPSGQVQDAYTCAIGAIVVTDSTTAPDMLDVVYANGGSLSSLTQLWDGAAATIVINDDSGQATQFFVGDTLLISNFAQGTMVHVLAVGPPVGTNVTITIDAPSCLPNIPAGGYSTGSLVLRVLHAQFFVGLVDNIPTLMIDPDATGPLPPEPLAENIEDMQIALGVDANGNDEVEPTEWLYSAAAPGPNPIGLQTPIRGVRITLTSRSTSLLSGGTAGVSFTPAAEDRAAGLIDAYRRRVLTSTIEIRNLSGSP